MLTAFKDNLMLLPTLIAIYISGIIIWVAVWAYKINRSNIKPNLRRAEFEWYILSSPFWPLSVPILLSYYLLITLPAKLLIKD